MQQKVNARRRQMLTATAMCSIGSLLPIAARAAADKILIGYWPIAAGLPFYLAVENGFFKEAGLNVEAVRFASPSQIAEAMVAGRIHGSANGTASAALGLAEIVSPGLLKIVCSNPANYKHVLDEFLVPIDSTVKSIKDLKGKKVACGPGIQNIVLTKIMLEKNGITDVTPIELPVGQHVPALAAGQIDAVYTLEPTGTVGTIKKLTRVLETGVISKYVLDDPEAPWFGGTASVTTTLIKERPEAVRKYVAAYAKGVDYVQKNPDQARQAMEKYTSIDKEIAQAVPLANFVMYNQFTDYDIAAFQKFFDVFTDKKIFTQKVDVKSLMYAG